MSLIPAGRSLTPSRRPLPAPREVGLAVARRVVPLIAASAATVVASIAAERALAGLAMRAVGGAGERLITPHERAAAVRRTVVVTETTVVERMRHRR